VVAYDRRQASTGKNRTNKPLNTVQHCRDIIAIVRSLGQGKTSIFASGAGGIIAIQLAVSYPEAVDHMIIHETPTLSVVPGSNFYLYNTYHIRGAQAATAAFHSMLQDRENGLPLSHPRPQNAEGWRANDVLLLRLHGLDLARVVDNKVSIAVATGI
jgi:pimeloyl-ACP methyl ester carboxylesterase